jgi:hypothetical protein
MFNVAVLALSVGGLFYIAFRPSGLLMFSWFDTVGLTPVVKWIRAVAAPSRRVIPGWMIYSLPQALWAFALVVFVVGIWVRDDGAAKFIWIGLAMVVGLLPEVGQWVGFVSGTFDPIDLSSVMVAVMVAFSTVFGGRNEKACIVGSGFDCLRRSRRRN